jgi:hypothetical protein
MLFKVYSWSAIRESVLEYRHGATATLDYDLALMECGRENIQIFNEGGERLSLADLLGLVDEAEARDE